MVELKTPVTSAVRCYVSPQSPTWQNSSFLPSLKMDALRRADAKVAQATHPRRNTKWRMQRYNPLFYIKRIINNLKSVGRRRH
ncbi:hypothetical protein MPTK1_3g20290 [Marchantia polymorpha subsp. ruderalis]|uniref:Uncharacterized protein n=2 Tax=Marchantia polymorpha TaxID=3197 RepID=A0AAF6B2V8_MARPO|nr:hypothetical protein MARPO_0049s0004 [Marchantia polymorpha]BBN06342.1 hypothetical protein Mp_3g20290 [Marchantia polymorpha subsp. ruderalis]|eukprot:PTQ38699.1 hypothetical protein MARPO_0049s0004 [Marchantia polymorpha]